MPFSLGHTVLVALPEQITDRYNQLNPHLNPVNVGTVRPALIVGESEFKDGNRTLKTFNLRVLYDGQGDFFVQDVPEDELAELGKADSLKDKPADQPPAHDVGIGQQQTQPSWDPARSGTGEPFLGQGPGAPPLTGQMGTPVPPLQGIPAGQPTPPVAPPVAPSVAPPVAPPMDSPPTVPPSQDSPNSWK